MAGRMEIYLLFRDSGGWNKMNSSRREIALHSREKCFVISSAVWGRVAPVVEIADVFTGISFAKGGRPVLIESRFAS